MEGAADPDFCEGLKRLLLARRVEASSSLKDETRAFVAQQNRAMGLALMVGSSLPTR